MAETQTKDLLDRLLDYKVVILDGEKYEVKNQDALSLLDFRWIVRKQARFAELWNNAEPPTPEESAEFSEILRACVGIVLNASAEVKNSLTDIHRKQILDFFWQSSPETETSHPTNGHSKPSGRKSSRG